MDPSRWRATVVLGSDHAGINQELGRLEDGMLAALARIDDALKVRNYLDHMRRESKKWCEQNHVDMRGWVERTRREVGGRQTTADRARDEAAKK